MMRGVWVRLPAAIALVVLMGSAEAASRKSRHHHHAPQPETKVLTVTASAYNATRAQTDGGPYVGAWGDRLDEVPPGTQPIAVSPDLAAKGLRHHRRVRIRGMEGEFEVLDRTPARWHNTIDIFMDQDVTKARHFGRRTVKLYWAPTHWVHDSPSVEHAR